MAPGLRPLDEDLRPSRQSRGTLSYWLVFAAAFALTPVLALCAGAPPPLAIVATAMVAPLCARAFDRLVQAPRVAKRFNAEMLPLAERLSRGQLDEVEPAYRALLRRYRGRGGLRPSCGSTSRRVRAPRRHPRCVAHRRHPTSLPGDATRSQRRQPDSVADGASLGPAHIEALILIREGKYAEAESAYQREWADLERILPADAMLGVVARRAFALDRSGADEATVQRWVDAARPSRPEELRHLAASWDEMRAFLEKNRLL